MRRLVAFLFLVAALLVFVVPAFGGGSNGGGADNGTKNGTYNKKERGCPDGYSRYSTGSYGGYDYDLNGNGYVCVKFISNDNYYYFVDDISN